MTEKLSCKPTEEHMIDRDYFLDADKLASASSECGTSLYYHEVETISCLCWQMILLEAFNNLQNPENTSGLRKITCK
jgi:hypothetical protein